MSTDNCLLSSKKAFEIVELKQGETKTISFNLTQKELGFFNNNGDFIVEPGDFQVFIGSDSSTSLKESFVLEWLRYNM